MKAVYRQRLAELRQMRANLAATSAAAVMPQAPHPAGCEWRRHHQIASQTELATGIGC